MTTTESIECDVYAVTASGGRYDVNSRACSRRVGIVDEAPRLDAPWLPYWWPHRGGQQEGRLIEQLRAGELTASGLRIVLEAGRNEPLIFNANQAIYAELPAQQQGTWRQVDGGHDALCWRGGLTQGLITLWQPLIH